MRNWYSLSKISRSVDETYEMLPQTEQPYYYTGGMKYHSAKDKEFSSMMQEYLLLKRRITTEYDRLSSSEKIQINNRFKELGAEIRKRKPFKTLNRVVSDEELEGLLESETDPKRALRTRRFTAPIGHQQGFRADDEEIIAVYLDRETYRELAKDPLIEKFLQHMPFQAHITSVIWPIGWATVDIKTPGVWFINQVQSDIMQEFRAVQREKKDRAAGKPERSMLTREELQKFLEEHDRGALLPLIIQSDQNLPEGIKGFEQRLRERPEIALEDLPIARTSEEAMQASLAIQKKRIALEGTIFNSAENSIWGNDTLSKMDLSELNYLEEKLRWIIDEWPRIVFHAVWREAKKEGVKELYWNTPENVKGGAPHPLRQVMYKGVPESLGFRKQKTNLRDKEEEFWHRQASSDMGRERQQISEILSTILSVQPVALYYGAAASKITALYDYPWPHCFDNQFLCKSSVDRELSKIIAQLLGGKTITPEQTEFLSQRIQEYMEHVGNLFTDE